MVANEILFKVGKTDTFSIISIITPGRSTASNSPLKHFILNTVPHLPGHNTWSEANSSNSELMESYMVVTKLSPPTSIPFLTQHLLVTEAKCFFVWGQRGKSFFFLFCFLSY